MKPGERRKFKGASGSALGFGGGLSWEVDGTERKAARKFLSFLEDRRVLFNSIDLEDRGAVMSSIDSIRSKCTDIIAEVDDAAPLASGSRAIRQACHRFADKRQGMVKGEHVEGDFLIALGEFRATCGIHILAIAQFYEMDLEPGLARSLPGGEDPDA